MTCTPRILSDKTGFLNIVCGVKDIFYADNNQSMTDDDRIAICGIIWVLTKYIISFSIMVCRR